MTPQSAPSTAFDAIHRAYAAELPIYLQRLGLPAEDAAETEQDVWLAVTSNPAELPADVNQARDALFLLAFRIAERRRRQTKRDTHRRHAIEPDELPSNVPLAEDVAQARELLDAIDRLDEPLRKSFILHKVLGFKIREIATKLRLKESTVSKRIWAASAQLQKKFGRKDDEKKRGVVIAPANIEIKIEVRAAMCAIWAAEGRLPDLGGPSDPPPPPAFIAQSTPATTSAKEAASKVRATALLLILALVPPSLIALYFFWEPAVPDTARAGLHVPPTPDVGAINDVVDTYPHHAPAAPSAQASKPKATPKASEALDEDAVHELDGPVLTRSGE